jgi:hypothetical protein
MTRMLPSALAVTTLSPSGVNAAEMTAAVWSTNP